MGQLFPLYEAFLIAVGPVVLAGLWLLFHRTRWGTLVRAATQDREMVAALGVDQSRLFTAVFFLGAVLAGLGGGCDTRQQERCRCKAGNQRSRTSGLHVLPRSTGTVSMAVRPLGAAFAGGSGRAADTRIW